MPHRHPVAAGGAIPFNDPLSHRLVAPAELGLLTNYQDCGLVRQCSHAWAHIEPATARIGPPIVDVLHIGA